MSNEELVAAIQAGEIERMGELWEQVERLVKWKAKRIMTNLDLRGTPRGVEFEDLYQTGYLALAQAVETYDTEAGGAFSTWFMYYIRKAFAKAAGYQTEREYNEPLNTALSLDKPVTNESDSALFGDFIPDNRAASAMEEIEEKEYQRQLREAVESVLADIPEQSREIIRMRIFQNMTLQQVAEIQGTTPKRISEMEHKAIRQLRKPTIARRLRPFYDFDFYCGTGLGAFQHTGMSIQERYLMIEEESKERAARRQRELEEQERQRREQELKTTSEYFARLDKKTEEYLQSLSPESRAVYERQLAKLRGTSWIGSGGRDRIR